VLGGELTVEDNYGTHEVKLPAGLPDWQRHLLTDPQTSDSARRFYRLRSW